MNSNFTSSDLPEMIDLFLDNELSVQETGMLFNSLAGNTELQATFQQSVQLIRSAVADAQTVSVPPPNINEIFKKAGLASTLSELAPASSIVSLWSKYAPLAVTAGVSSILTFIITFMLMSENRLHQQTDQMQYTSKGLNTTREPYSVTTNSTLPPKTISGMHSYNNSNNSIGTNEVKPQLHKDRGENPINSFDNTEPRTQDEMVYHTTSISTITPVSSTSDESNATKTFDEILLPATPELEDDLGIIVQLRGIGGIGFGDEPSLAPKKSSSSSNIGIAGYFRFNEKEMVGIELGQEELPDLHIKDNASSRYSAVTFATLSYRYSLRQYSETGVIKPFGQVGVGGTQLGAIARISLGLEWQPIHNLGITAGTDFSAMTYRYDNRFQLAKKVGLFAGISIGF